MISSDSLRQSHAPESRPVLAAVAAFCVLWAVVPLLLFGPAVLDDAYITFRYADNLAAGKGFVYNVEDGPVLGTSTPLFTFLLTAGKVAGIPCPTGALTLSVAGAAAAYFFGFLLFWLAGEKQRMLAAGVGWMLVLGTLPEWIFVQISGMETMFFVGLAVAAIWATASGRPTTSAILAALVVLTRYDGWALGMIVLGWNVYTCRRKALPGVLVFVVLQAPWIVYALSTFGSYWPQSVAAKHIIHKRAMWGEFVAQASYFSLGLKGMVGSFLHRNLLPFFVAGIITLAMRRSRALLLLAWGAASVAGFSYAGILLQRWYLMPALLVFAWVAVWGAWTVFDRLAAHRSARLLRWVFPVAVMALLVAVHLRATLPGHRQWPRVNIVRERTYFEAAAWVQEHGRPGQTVLVGETGALGWALEDFRVIDSSGINSRLVHAARVGDMERVRREGVALPEPDLGTADFVRRVIRETKPDYLISIEMILHLGTLKNDPAFARDYTLAQVLRIHPSPLVYVYERKK